MVEAEQQGDRQLVSPGFGRVVDQEGAEGDEGGREDRGPAPDGARPDKVGEGDGQHPGEQGGQAEHLR